MHDDFVHPAEPTRYFDKNFDCEAVKISPGEYFVTARDMLIVTVLGSCVSVCMRDSISGVGGMNHFMLPGASELEDSPNSRSARYGSYAMDILINHLLKLGAVRHRLEAKVFGGARVLPGFSVNNVGDRNTEFILHYLDTERIPVLAQDLLDIYPRKVYFFPGSGRVLVRKLKSLHNRTIIDRELEYRQRLKKTEAEGDIELFS